MHPSPSRSLARRAFTLIELLIVVGIIGLLVAIGLMVGNKVVGGGKERLTQDIIRVLDASAVDYEAVKHELPSAKLVVGGGSEKYEFPILDARLESAGVDRVGDPAVNSIARYTAALAPVPQALAAITGVGAKGALGRDQIRQLSIATVTVGGKPVDVQGQEILDAWGNPIRVVMPGFDGGFGKYFESGSLKTRPSMSVSYAAGSGTTTEIYRRSYRPFNPASISGQPVGDADEGICPSRRLYFYSAGPDGDAGKREDNVYSTRPQFPAETAQLE